MDYSIWLKKNYPKIVNTPFEIVCSYINEAKTETKLFREFVKVVAAICLLLPLNLYIYLAYSGFIYWLLTITSFAIVDFVLLYVDQKVIKHRLKKIVNLKSN